MIPIFSALKLLFTYIHHPLASFFALFKHKYGIFLKKYPWCMNIYFQFYFLAIQGISTSILSITAWKAPASSWSPSELAMFFNIDPRCFGSSSKFQDTKEISNVDGPCFQTFRFFWLCWNIEIISFKERDC